MNTKTVLVVEDEERVAELLREYLERDGFSVHCLYSGAIAVEWVKENTPDLVLLDQMLPVKDGMSILREIRTFSKVPVMMATAKTEELDRLVGLESGADDYVCKPYSFREVVARVKAVLRRAVPESYPSETVAPASPLTLNQNHCSVALLGEEIELTVIEFRLLEVLSGRPGQIFSREQLMDQIYSDGRVVSDRTIDSHIRKLRAKLQVEGAETSLISSVYSAGYRLDWAALDD